MLQQNLSTKDARGQGPLSILPATILFFFLNFVTAEINLPAVQANFQSHLQFSICP